MWRREEHRYETGRTILESLSDFPSTFRKGKSLTEQRSFDARGTLLLEIILHMLNLGNESITATFSERIFILSRQAGRQVHYSCGNYCQFLLLVDELEELQL